MPETDPHESICMWPFDGRAPRKDARPCNRSDCPHCRLGAVTPEGWRLGITFPVELEEVEAGVIEAAIREKFMSERPPAAGQLIGKMRRVLDKFRDKRREDEAFASSLTDEERQIIRDRRVNMTGKAK